MGEISEQRKYATTGGFGNSVFPQPGAGPEVDPGLIAKRDDEVRAVIVGGVRDALHIEDAGGGRSIVRALARGMLLHRFAEVLPIEVFGVVGRAEGDCYSYSFNT